MGIGAAVGAGAIGSAAALASSATIAGGIAAVGGTAYQLSKGSPKAPSAAALPPSATPPTLSDAANSGALQNKSKQIAGAIGSGYDGTLSTSPLGTSAPSTAKSSLLGS